MTMPGDRPKKPRRLDTKLARMRDAYRKMLRRPNLTDQEIDEIRQCVIRIAQALCEHVWGKRFY